MTKFFAGVKYTYDLALLVDFLHHLPAAKCKTTLMALRRYVTGHLVVFEPITYQTNILGRWVMANDRGHYIRPLTVLETIIETAGFSIIKSRPFYMGPSRTQAILAIPSRRR